MTATSYTCIYLTLQLAKKVNNIYHNFKTKHLNENSHIEIVDNYILLYPIVLLLEQTLVLFACDF